MCRSCKSSLRDGHCRSRRSTLRPRPKGRTLRGKLLTDLTSKNLRQAINGRVFWRLLVPVKQKLRDDASVVLFLSQTVQAVYVGLRDQADFNLSSHCALGDVWWCGRSCRSARQGGRRGCAVPSFCVFSLLLVRRKPNARCPASTQLPT